MTSWHQKITQEKPGIGGEDYSNKIAGKGCRTCLENRIEDEKINNL
jgi:hypothetical protein